ARPHCGLVAGHGERFDGELHYPASTACVQQEYDLPASVTVLVGGGIHGEREHFAEPSPENSSPASDRLSVGVGRGENRQQERGASDNETQRVESAIHGGISSSVLLR